MLFWGKSIRNWELKISSDLRIKTKETGFLVVSAIRNEVFAKKPGF
jgi:hypothetical protein